MIIKFIRTRLEIIKQKKKKFELRSEKWKMKIKKKDQNYTLNIVK